MNGTYFRWTWDGPTLNADILGTDTGIRADPATGNVTAVVPTRPLSPDEARMIGVRLIEAAALADNGRSVRGGRTGDTTR
jgi:hypothetical protein